MSNVTEQLSNIATGVTNRIKNAVTNVDILKVIKTELKSDEYRDKTNEEKKIFLTKKISELDNKTIENTIIIENTIKENDDIKIYLESKIQYPYLNENDFQEIEDFKSNVQKNDNIISLFRIYNDYIADLRNFISTIIKNLDVNINNPAYTSNIDIMNKIKLIRSNYIIKKIDDKIKLFETLLTDKNKDTINPMLVIEKEKMENIVNDLTTLPDENTINNNLNTKYSTTTINEVNKYINSQAINDDIISYIDTDLLTKSINTYYKPITKTIKSGVKGVLNLFGRKKGNKNKTPYAMSFNPSPTQAQRYIENKATVNTYFFPYENLKHPGLHSKIVVDVNYDSTNIDYMDIVDDILNTLRGDSSQLSQAEKITKTYRTRVPAD